MASCCEVTRVIKTQPVSLLPSPDFMGKEEELHISERRKSFGGKKKTCTGVLGAARASVGAWLVHILTPEAPDKPE